MMEAPHANNQTIDAITNQKGMTLESLETLKFWVEVAVTVFGLLAAGAAVWVLYLSTRVNALKDRANAEFRATSTVAIKTADARAAEANQKAASASEGMAKALAQAAEANKLAEGFRLDIAKANERATAANEIAEKERLARMQLEAKLAPRRLSKAQQQSITAALKGAFAAQIFIYADTTEVQQIGDEIASTLAAAGWSIGFGKATGGIMVTGIVVAFGKDAPASAKNAATRLVGELVKNGVGASLAGKPMEEIPGPGMVFGSQVENPQIRIMIGNK